MGRPENWGHLDFDFAVVVEEEREGAGKNGGSRERGREEGGKGRDELNE